MFAFRVGKKMLARLRIFLAWASSEIAKGVKGFTDQAFANEFFNRQLVSVTQTGPFSSAHAFLDAHPEMRYNQTFLHFIGGGINYGTLKLRSMQTYVANFLPDAAH